MENTQFLKYKLHFSTFIDIVSYESNKINSYLLCVYVYINSKMVKYFYNFINLIYDLLTCTLYIYIHVFTRKHLSILVLQSFPHLTIYFTNICIPLNDPHQHHFSWLSNSFLYKMKYNLFNQILVVVYIISKFLLPEAML